MQDLRVFVDNALYVSGTVNGVDKVWTRESGNWWTTQADKSENGAYVIDLSIVYGDGKTVSDSVTLYYGLILVTDRTQQDVFNKTEKGFYNASDLNRVGAAMVYLRDKFNNNGYDVDIDPNVSWREEDIPTKDDMSLYLLCVGVIRGVLPLPDGTPETPSTMDKLTYLTANNIEKILEAVDDVLTNSISFLHYSGDIYSGEVI